MEWNWGEEKGFQVLGFQINTWTLKIKPIIITDVALSSMEISHVTIFLYEFGLFTFDFHTGITRRTLEQFDLLASRITRLTR